MKKGSFLTWSYLQSLFYLKILLQFSVSTAAWRTASTGSQSICPGQRRAGRKTSKRTIGRSRDENEILAMKYEQNSRENNSQSFSFHITCILIRCETVFALNQCLLSLWEMSSRVRKKSCMIIIRPWIKGLHFLVIVSIKVNWPYNHIN